MAKKKFPEEITLSWASVEDSGIKSEDDYLEFITTGKEDPTESRKCVGVYKLVEVVDIEVKKVVSRKKCR